MISYHLSSFFPDFSLKPIFYPSNSFILTDWLYDYIIIIIIIIIIKLFAGITVFRVRTFTAIQLALLKEHSQV